MFFELIGRPLALLLEPELEKGNDAPFSALMAEEGVPSALISTAVLGRLLRSESPRVREKAVNAVRAFDALSPYQDVFIDLVTSDKAAFSQAYERHFSEPSSGGGGAYLRWALSLKNSRHFIIMAHFVGIQIELFKAWRS